MVRPFTPFKLDGTYGKKRSYGWHSGADYNGPDGGNSDCGWELKAITDGKIVFAEDKDSGYGNIVVYEINGPWGRRWVRYSHCQSIIASGNVREGQPIALMGSTGNSTACHLHMDVLKKSDAPYWRTYARNKTILNDYFIDPESFLDTWINYIEQPDIPKWLNNLFKAEVQIDLSKAEGEVREKLNVLFSEYKRSSEKDKRIKQLEKDYAGVSGQSAEFEERLRLKEREFEKATNDLQTTNNLVVQREKEISNLVSELEDEIFKVKLLDEDLIELQQKYHELKNGYIPNTFWEKLKFLFT